VGLGGRLACRWGWPAVPQPLLWCGVFSSLLEPLGVVFAMDKCDFIWQFDAPWWFLDKPCWKQRFTKTHGNYQFKPLSLCRWSFSCTISSYVDGLWWMVTTVNTPRSPCMVDLTLGLGSSHPYEAIGTNHTRYGDRMPRNCLWHHLHCCCSSFWRIVHHFGGVSTNL